MATFQTVIPQMLSPSCVSRVTGNSGLTEACTWAAWWNNRSLELCLVSEFTLTEVQTLGSFMNREIVAVCRLTEHLLDTKHDAQHHMGVYAWVSSVLSVNSLSVCLLDYIPNYLPVYIPTYLLAFLPTKLLPHLLKILPMHQITKRPSTYKCIQ